MRSLLQAIHQFQLFVRPTLAGLLLCAVWYYVVWGRFGYDPRDQSIFADLTIPALAAFHAIGAGFVLHKVWSEYTHVRNCLRTNDKEAFIRTRGDRIPLQIHLLLGSIACTIMVNLMLQHYYGATSGFGSIFSISFVLALYFEVAVNLDNPRKAVWYMGQIPKDWFTDPPSNCPESKACI